MSVKAETSRDFRINLTLTRRGFVKTGGALFVSLYLPGRLSASRTEKNQTSLDPSQLVSWLEIRDDNTILMRTGRTETGTGMSGYYAQAIAEELNVRPETISLLMGDTDKTPDGGYSAGFLTGMDNVRKVSAYTYQALLLGLKNSCYRSACESRSVRVGRRYIARWLHRDRRPTHETGKPVQGYRDVLSCAQHS